MALPASGPISFNNINVELGVAGTTTASLGQASYRSLAGVASGAISLSNFYGKSSMFAFNITTANNVDLRTAAIAAGWNQSSALQATIPSGNTIGSTSAGSAALTISGSFPGGVTLINSGTIKGAGGAGGLGGSYYGAGVATYPYSGSPGIAGGTAITISSPVSINNAGTVAGGGGGGGGGGQGQQNNATPKGVYAVYPAGGGGGGGAGSIVGAGGPGGGPGVGGNSTPGNAGSPGTATTGGAGGTTNPSSITYPAPGGAGGGLGSAGTPGTSPFTATWPVLAGGAAGYYVTGNSNVTWIATGTRLGNVS